MKGHGALSDFLNKHKVTVPDKLLEQELTLQAAQRQGRVKESGRFHGALSEHADGGHVQDALFEIARQMRLDPDRNASGELSLSPIVGPVQTTRAPKRNKRIA